ncbi:uncharacterized protein G2W53_006481 [Senna tora]|uniref:Uncharacterized protein n=1 Tax=Senna tora TaxID=362788 RepID=A0A834X4R9_9FABA|nr:uncharacterized protein G2W53_006481 [Senna tora]
MKIGEGAESFSEKVGLSYKIPTYPLIFDRNDEWMGFVKLEALSLSPATKPNQTRCSLPLD